MPTNVTVEYAIAERESLNARTTEEKLSALRKMLSTCPDHKGTEKLRKDIKQRMARLRRLAEVESKKKGVSTSIRKEGAAQVVLMGYPNVGRSTILAALTGATPKIGSYPFTTREPEVGIMKYAGVGIQVIELPAIYRNIEPSSYARFFSIARDSDMIAIVADPSTVNSIPEIVEECGKAKIRLNRKKPRVRIERRLSGGIDIIGAGNVSESSERIRQIIRDSGVHNAIVEIGERVTPSELTDVLDEGVSYKKAIVVMNRCDSPEQVLIPAEIKSMFNIVTVSRLSETDIMKLKEGLWNSLGLIRVFTKEPGKKPKMDEPVCLKKGSRIADMAGHIHKDFVRNFRFARVWGSSSRFRTGQVVGINHVLHDSDIVELHMR